MPQSTPTKIAVIGGGIAGLTAAHELAVAGHSVVLLESSDQLGGLGTYYDWNGHWIDRFYHCQMPSDDDLIQLIEDVGMIDEMYWKPTRMGFIVNKKRYAFNGALDLLKFDPLSFVERIRFGVISLLLRQLGKGKDLDNVRIEDWLAGLYGQSIWKKILRPLFQSKFGPAAGDMPALYIWERLGREKNTVSRGYLKGGLKALIDGIVAKLVKLGVEIRKNAEVRSIDEIDGRIDISLRDETQISADWCISTLPLTLLDRVVRGTNLETAFKIPDVRYQGVVNAMFYLKRPLDNYYWTPVVDSGTEFDGIVEMTELIETEHYGGHHVVYVMKYCDRESDFFQEPEEQIAARWKEQLLSLYPDLGLESGDVADVRVFKAPFVEPAYPLGYGQLKPALDNGKNRLLLATSAQVYPRITAWNSSVWLAKQVVGLLEARIAASPAATGKKQPWLRTVFGDGDGSDFHVIETELGRIGALNCWEHLQPLSRMAMYSMHEEIHIAGWPSFCCYRDMAYALGPEVNIDGASRMYAVEGSCYVLASVAVTGQDCFDMLCDTPDKAALLNPRTSKPGGGTLDDFRSGWPGISRRPGRRPGRYSVRRFRSGRHQYREGRRRPRWPLLTARCVEPGDRQNQTPRSPRNSRRH